MAKKVKKKLSERDEIVLSGMTAEHMRRLVNEEFLDVLRHYIYLDLDRENRSTEQILDNMLEELSPLIRQHALFGRVLHELFDDRSLESIKRQLEKTGSAFLKDLDVVGLLHDISEAHKPTLADIAKGLEQQHYECKSQIDALKAMKKKYSDIVIPPKLIDKYDEVQIKLKDIYDLYPELKPSIADGV